MENRALRLATGVVALSVCLPTSLGAQPIIPAADGTHTVVTPTDNRFDITGGALSEDGANLFHSFQEFGLSAEQIANFLVNPNIQTVLGRVSGGHPSIINGLLQVSGGNANLLFMNPAGIVFGPDSALNLSGGFTATTADGIGFGPDWFHAVGSSDYAALVGNPDTFSFSVSQPGAIFNAGDLRVNAGETLRLLGGSVINTGILSAPGGTITVAAVPGQQWVRISQDNAVLSLDLPLVAVPEAAVPTTDVPIAPLDIPTLLTGSGLAEAGGVAVHEDGRVTLTGSDVALPSAPGTAIASGRLDASCIAADCSLITAAGGAIALLGTTVGVLDGTLLASGTQGGGEILIGGDYLGQGAVPNAAVTAVDGAAVIAANALTGGDGGRVIVWSDQTSRIAGEIQARGGATSGDGGFVETSSAGFLEIQGTPDVSAPAGTAGSWLIDPSDIEIGDFGGVSTGIDFTAPFSGTTGTAQLDVADLRAALMNGTDVTVSTANPRFRNFQAGDLTLSAPLDFNGIGNNTSLTLEANQQITIAAPIFDADTASATADSLNLTLDGRRGVVINPGAAINTQGGDIAIETLTADGNEVAIAINSEINSAGGDITLQAGDSNTDGIVVNAAIVSGGGDIEFDGRGDAAGIKVNAPIDAGSGALRLSRGGFGAGQVGIAIGPAGELIVEADPTHSRDIEILSNSASLGTGIDISRAIDTQGRNLILNGARGVRINPGAALNTQGGNLTIESISISGAGIQIDETISSAGGAIDINGRGSEVGVAVNAAIEVGEGALTLSGTAAGSDGIAGVVLGPDGDLIVDADPTHSRDIAINSDNSTGTGVDIRRAIDTQGRNLMIDANQGVLINPGAAIDTQGGNLTIEATSSAGTGVVIDEGVDSGGGDVNISANGSEVGLTINAPLDAGSGALRLETGNFGSGSASILLTPNGELIVEADPTHSRAIELISNGSVNPSFGIQLQNVIDTQGRNLIINGRRGVQIEPGAGINSQGGDVNIEANVFSGDGIVVGANIDSAGGAIDIDGNGSGPGLTVNAVIDAGRGDLRLNGESNGDGAGLILNPTGELVVEDDPTHSRNIEISSSSFSGAGAVMLNRAIDTRGRNLIIDGRFGVVINPGAVIDTQGGDVSIEANGFAGNDAIGITVNEQINSAGGSVDIAGRGSGPGVTVNAAIDVGSGDLRLSGNTRGDGAGLVINPTGELRVAADPTNTGTIELFNDSFGGTGITLDRAIDTQGRNLVISSRRGVLIDAMVETQGGGVTIESTSFSEGAVGIVVNEQIDSAGGAIDIDGTGDASGLTVNAVIDAGSGDLRLNGDARAGRTGFTLNPTGELVVAADPTHDSTITISSNRGATPGVVLNRAINTQGRNLVIDSRPGVEVNPGALIESQGGNITIESAGLNSGGIVVDEVIDSAGGAIDIDGTGDDRPGLVVNAAIDAGSGNLRLNGGTQVPDGAGLVLNPAGELIVEADPTHTGTIQLDSTSARGTGITLNRPIDTQGRNLVVGSRGGLRINPGAAVDTQGGNITIASDNGSTSAIGIVVDETVDSGGGAIDIDGLGGGPGLTINAAIDAGSGNLRLNGRSRGDGAGLILNSSGELIVEDDPTHSSTIEILSNVLSGASVELNREIDTRGRNLTISGRRGVLVNPGAFINSQGGNIQIASSTTASSSIGVVINENIDSAGGAIDIDGSGSGRGLTVNSVIDAGSGNLRFNGDTGGDGPGLLLSDISEIVVEDDPTHSSTIEISSTSFSAGTGVTIDTVLDTQGRNLIINGRRGVFVNTDSSVTTQGGSITIQSSSNNSAGLNVAGAIDAGGGDITLDLSAPNSAIEVGGSISTRSATINLEAREDIRGGGNIANAGGDISIISAQGSISVDGEVNTSSSTSDAGNILIQTETSENNPNPTGDITTGLLLANSEASPGNGGNIQVEATGASANITTGNITTRSGPTGDGGDITLTTPVGTINTIGGTLLSLGATNGGNITLTAGSDIDTANIEVLLVSGFTQDSGSINLVSTGGDVDTSVGALISSAAAGTGGDISLEALMGNLTLGTVNSQSINGAGGELTFTPGQDIFLATGSVSTNNNDIEFNHRVNLVGDAAVNSFGSGDVVFNTPVDGAHRLAVNADQGEILLNEAVGSTTPLAEFAFQGNLRATTTAGFDIGTGQITLLGDAGITTPDDAGIVINSALNGPHTLTLDAGNDSLELNAPLGNLAALNSLTLVDDVTTPNAEGISIATINEIETQNITAPGGIRLISRNGPIAADDLDTSASGDAGDVTIATDGTVSIDTVNAQSETGVGGAVDITANDFLQVTDTFADQNEVEASISVAGGDAGGTVIIRHGGQGNTPFTVGDSDTNGTEGAIARGDDDIQRIEPEESFLNTFTQDNERLQLVSVPAAIPPVPTGEDGSAGDGSGDNPGNIPGSNPGGGLGDSSGGGDFSNGGGDNGGGGSDGSGGGGSNGNGVGAADAQSLLAGLIGQLLDAETLAIADEETGTTTFEWVFPDGEDISLGVEIPPEVGVIPIPADQPADVVSLLDEQREEEFEEYFGRELRDRSVTAQSMRQTLSQIEAETETRAAVIYATSRAESLELVMIMAEGNAVLVEVPAANAAALDDTIRRLTRAISGPRANYRQPAEQLHSWLIAPLQPYLDEQAIDNLVFIMDAGLRALPLAALHDGDQFLIEQYSLGLVPSFSLTDSRYQSMADSQVLAFGMSDFEQWTDLEDLLFIEPELAKIADRWPGAQFLDQGFTLAELQTQRRREQFDIIHLATHAVFEAQGPENSYIQLWDQRLGTDQLDSLRWNAPPQVELLVLSACQTALGSREAELGFAGLAVNAGVKSALASLWNVNDASTATLMATFYTALQTESTKAAALRQAQLTLLSGEATAGDLTSRASLELNADGESTAARESALLAGDFSHPYYWAAFTMVGSPW